MLTDTQARAAKQGIRTRRLADAGGLYLQIDPNGRRYWRYNYRFAGKQKTLALNIYPDVSIAKARELLREAKAQLAQGFTSRAGTNLSRQSTEHAVTVSGKVFYTINASTKFAGSASYCEMLA